MNYVAMFLYIRSTYSQVGVMNSVLFERVIIELIRVLKNVACLVRHILFQFRRSLQ